MAKRTPKPCKACGLIECECFARLSAAIMNTPRVRPPKRTYFECVTASETLECDHCGGFIPNRSPILITDDRVICSLHCAVGIQREGVSGPRLPAENDEKEV